MIFPSRRQYIAGVHRDVAWTNSLEIAQRVAHAYVGGMVVDADDFASRPWFYFGGRPARERVRERA